MLIFDRAVSAGHTEGTTQASQPQSRPVFDLTLGPAVRRLLRHRLPRQAVVGLIASTGWPLIQAWQACLEAGCVPIILHFPTPKLSRVYWQAEIEHGIKSAGVSLLICQDAGAVPLDAGVPVVLMSELERTAATGEPFDIPQDGAILQMSSGTTGHRKAIRFDLRDVRGHVAAYNKALALTPDDCIVSWLPLYHDMGFIAAFVMPRLTGCKLVMMDPIDWIRQPEMLWQAIDAHQGSICYMPNFGFEVMSARAQPAPSIRRWISCSEPTRASTMHRFAEATGTDPMMMTNCWGMAENIFAVCLSEGIRAKEIDGAKVVSCGRPIPGTEVKSVEGELFVRSDQSLREYIGVPLQLDDDGYYASGDLGRVEDGEVYLLGRQKDIINVAGRKSLASDIDFMIGEEVPGSAGRIATFSLPDPDLGTDRAVILVEHPKFWEQNRDLELVKRLVGRSGIEGAQVNFVPPRFITKTSSGKVNRKETRENWVKRQQALEASGPDAGTALSLARAEIASLFPWLNHDAPLADQIDSLGFVNLSLVLARHRIVDHLDPTQTLSAVLRGNDTGGSDEVEVIKIVSLCDGNPFRGLASPLIDSLHEIGGKPVQFTHLCVPPIEILLSDLVFADYFKSRDERAEAYSGVMSVLEDLRNANLVLIDDSYTLFWPPSMLNMVYPRISHDFQPDDLSPFLGVRWARYSEAHHKLAFNVVSGALAAPEQVNEAVETLGSYLGVPIVRIAWGREHAEVTADWEVQCHATLQHVTAMWKFEEIDQEAFRAKLLAEIERAAAVAPSRRSNGGSFANWNDQAHWCSWLVNPAMVDFILGNFTDVAVLGKPSSVPYLAQEAERRGVRLRYFLDMAVPEDCECGVMAGSWGMPETTKPVFQLMAAGWPSEAPVINASPELAAACPPAMWLEARTACVAHIAARAEKRELAA